MIKSKLILVLFLSSITHLCYSQKLTSTLLREINIKLAERIECAQLLEEKTNQVIILNNLANEQTAVIDNLQKQVSLVEENNTISEGRERAMAEQVAKCNQDKEQSEKDAKRLRKARNRYAWIAGIETVVLAGIIYLSVR